MTFLLLCKRKSWFPYRKCAVFVNNMGDLLGYRCVRQGPLRNKLDLVCLYLSSMIREGDWTGASWDQWLYPMGNASDRFEISNFREYERCTKV